MADRNRLENGKFAPKSDENREVRSLRLTNATWQRLGELADSRCITRADLIEQLIQSGTLDEKPIDSGVSLQQVEELTVQIIEDPEITRHGKDKGSIKRALQTLLKKLS